MNAKIVIGAIALSLAAGAGYAASKADMRALGSAKLSLTDAIQAAEKEGNGRAVDADVETKQGGARYAVEVLSSDGKKLTEYKLNADTGKVEATRNEPIEKMVKRAKPEDLQNVKTSLTEAIRAAEQETSGKVIGAQTEGSGANIRYDLKVAKPDGKTEKVKISGATGKVDSAK
jgi:uncharacterized membrane protein YkoI